MAIYLDSSAIVKLVVAEAESDALTRRLADETLASSAIALAEVPRALGRRGRSSADRGRQLLRSVNLVAVDEPLLEHAAILEPPIVRTLDAIHIASALALGEDLDALVTYDRRMVEVAEQHGLASESPA